MSLESSNVFFFLYFKKNFIYIFIFENLNREYFLLLFKFAENSKNFHLESKFDIWQFKFFEFSRAQLAQKFLEKYR